MISLYTKKEAQQTILKRKSILDVELPERLKKGIKELFGRDLTAQEVVLEIIADVRNQGDPALIKWTRLLDKVELSSLEISPKKIEESLTLIKSSVLQALRLARDRIRAFHENQPIKTWMQNDMQLGQIVRPIEKVGIYVPGGTAPLPSTVLMCSIPAIVAGSSKLVICSPPNKKGKMDPTILAACQLLKELDVEVRVYMLGGAQAIAAMAYGTKQVDAVDKIVGPGNIFVSLAKKEVYGQVGIDGIYGPTEAMLLADESASSSLLAADLLAQAEHDMLSIPIMVTTSAKLAKAVKEEVEKQIQFLEREDIAKYSMENQGGIVITPTIEEAVEVCNNFAPEHLSIITKDNWAIIPKIRNAGGIFVGEYSCEVIGDYIAGPSHTMPTNGTAKFSSALSVYDFVKFINLIALDKKTSMELAKGAKIIAKEEKLGGHANAAKQRIEKKKKQDQTNNKLSGGFGYAQASIH